MAKYDGLRKLERNRILLEYADSHPDISLAEIGRAFNVSASRACRIIQKERARNQKGGIPA